MRHGIRSRATGKSGVAALIGVHYVVISALPASISGTAAATAATAAAAAAAAAATTTAVEKLWRKIDLQIKVEIILSLGVAGGDEIIAARGSMGVDQRQHVSA